jgi:hypothetical protein
MAGVNIGTAWLTIATSAKGISKGIEKDLKGAGTKAGQQFGTEFDKASSKATSSLDSFGTKALVGAAAVGAGFFGLASAAGDLSAAISANEQVLGSASDAVQAFAEAGVENVGLSETAVLNAATSFGQLGKIIGLTGGDLSSFSTDLVTASADMAAFKNNTPTEALADLQSAFAGSPEVLRKYGIFLDEASLKQAYFQETGETVTGTLTAQQRIVATNAEIWRQGADMWGQAARESDGLERSVADLKATAGNVAADFGAPIVGFASELLGAVTGGLTGLQDFNQETGGMLASGVAAGFGLAAAGAGMFGLVGKVKDAVKWYKDLSPAMQKATGALAGLSLAVGVGFVGYGLFTQRQREVAANTKEAGAALGDATREAWNYAEAAAGASGDIDTLAVANEALSDVLTGNTDAGEAMRQALGDLGFQADDAWQIMARFQTLETPADWEAFWVDMTENMGLTREQAELLAGFMGGELAQSTLEFGETAQSVGLTAEQFEAAADELENYRQAAMSYDGEALAQQFLNEAAAADEALAALVAKAEALAVDAGEAGNSAAVYEHYLALVETLPEAERDAALGVGDLADAHGDSAGATGDATSALVDNVSVMGDMQDAADRAAGKVDAFTGALDRLVGNALDVRDAQRQMLDTFDGLAEAALDAEGNTITLADAYNVLNDEGREFQAQTDDSITSIIDYGRAQLDAGASIEDATGLMLDQRNTLINEVAAALGITTAEATEYINTLGLTPESIRTAVELADVESRKADLQTWIDDLGGVPEEIATDIEAATDERSLELARQRLVSWAAQQNPTVFYSVLPRSGVGFTPGLTPFAQAYGGFWPGNSPALLMAGDAPWDEAMLTVGNIDNLRKQLTDPRIAGPILEALPQVDVDVGSGATNSSGGGRPFQFISYEQNPTPATVATAIRWAGTSA